MKYSPETYARSLMEIYREVLSRRAAGLQQQFTSLAARALKTAWVLGYWGHWREARDLATRFRVPKAWGLPYYTSSLAGRTPIGAAIGKVYRMVISSRG